MTINFEKQTSDHHCVPAVLRALVPGADIFTQEEIGYMVNTNVEGTLVKDTRPFLRMMGYRLKKTTPKWMEGGIIVDYKHDDGDDHWAIVSLGGYSNHLVFDPFTGYHTAIDAKRAYAYYKLDEI